MGYSFGLRSTLRLRGVHPDLVRVAKRAISISPTDFTVIEGVRSFERQQQLYANGASHTLHSRHLTGHAIDLGVLIGGAVVWGPWTLYQQLAATMKAAASMEKVPIEWGGEIWGEFHDGPHFQLPREKYP